jgi:hypothetical protein
MHLGPCLQEQLLAAISDVTDTAGTTAYEANDLISNLETGVDQIALTLINGPALLLRVIACMHAPALHRGDDRLLFPGTIGAAANSNPVGSVLTAAIRTKPVASIATPPPTLRPTLLAPTPAGAPSSASAGAAPAAAEPLFSIPLLSGSSPFLSGSASLTIPTPYGR